MTEGLNFKFSLNLHGHLDLGHHIGRCGLSIPALSGRCRTYPTFPPGLLYSRGQCQRGPGEHGSGCRAAPSPTWGHQLRWAQPTSQHWWLTGHQSQAQARPWPGARTCPPPGCLWALQEVRPCGIMSPEPSSRDLQWEPKPHTSLLVHFRKDLEGGLLLPAKCSLSFLSLGLLLSRSTLVCPWSIVSSTSGPEPPSAGWAPCQRCTLKGTVSLSL